MSPDMAFFRPCFSDDLQYDEDYLDDFYSDLLRQSMGGFDEDRYLERLDRINGGGG